MARMFCDEPIITKMVQSEIPMFEERTELKWREKVAAFKRD